MGGNERHLNVSFIARDKVTIKTASTNNFWREGRAQAESNKGPAYQLNALQLGQLAHWLFVHDTIRFTLEEEWGENED